MIAAIATALRLQVTSAFPRLGDSSQYERPAENTLYLCSTIQSVVLTAGVFFFTKLEYYYWMEY